MQMLCDSLRYSDLDSIARMYINPVVWNETTRQYTADSLFLLVRGGRADRANLMSNAFIACKESDKYYDQIKGTDVVAFFGEDSALQRFDALGGTTALFYLKENEEIATVNRVECKMMSATLSAGTVDKVHYYDSPKNDAYPVVQLPAKEHRLKGFVWKPDERPASKDDITTMELLPGERSRYLAIPEPEFSRTDVFFPGHMEQLYLEIEQARQMRRESRSRQAEASGSHPADSSASLSSVSPEDSLRTAALSDSLGLRSGVPADSLASADSLAAARDSVVQSARQLRIARRDARWAAKDAQDLAKAKAKEQKTLEKKRRKTARLYVIQRRQDAEDAAKLQKYIEIYTKRKAKEDERKQNSD